MLWRYCLDLLTIIRIKSLIASTDLIFFHLFLNENSSQQEVCQLSAFDFNFKLILALGIQAKALTVAYISSMTV